MLPSIIPFVFDLIQGVILGFLGPKWAILGVPVRIKNVLGSTYIVEQLSFSIIPSILAFEFDLIFGSFRLFGVLMG